MAFKAYLVTPAADGTLELTAPEPLVFSGRHGLIARHVLADPERASRPWTLLPDDLIKLTNTPPRAPSWIVLEQTEGSDLRLSRLEKIAGVSTEQTEILITLVPLSVIRRSPILTARELSSGRAWREELALDGGAFSRDSHWRWCNRPLNIGATVVG